MKARLIGLLSLALVVTAALVAQGQGDGQRAGGPEGQRGAAPPRPKRAVIVTGENSFNGHVWKDTSAEIKNILDAGKDFQDVVIQPDPNFIATDEFLTFDVAIFDFRNQNPLAQEEKVEANLLKFLDTANKGLVTVHWANGAFPYWPEFVNIVGRAQQSVHDRRGPFTVKIVNPNHPITRDMKDYETNASCSGTRSSATGRSRRLRSRRRTCISPISRWRWNFSTTVRVCSTRRWAKT